MCVEIDSNSIDYANLLSVSVRCGDVEPSKIVHCSILKLEEEDVYLKNGLIGANVKLGYLNLAEKVFDSLWSPDVVSYTAMIASRIRQDRLQLVGRRSSKMTTGVGNGGGRGAVEAIVERIEDFGEVKWEKSGLWTKSNF
ncbi:hypothetical protein FXO38_32062 [Capsicum annuum]|nr:hypothetical protein FXO38_32062 [Capsicum annuum]